MPVTIKSSQVKVKGTDGYIGVDALADSTTASRISAINSAGEAALEDIQSEGQSNVSAIEQKGAEVLESIPDEYTQLEEDVSDLKSAITQIRYGYIPLTEKGYINTTADVGSVLDYTSVTSTNNYRHYVNANVKAGDKFRINSVGGNSAYPYVWLNSNGIVLEKADSTKSYDTIITAPENAGILVCNFNITNTTCTASLTNLITVETALEHSDEIASDVKRYRNGAETFSSYSTFSYGGLTNGALNTYISRISSDTIMHFDRPLNIVAKSGYEFQINRFVNGEYFTQDGWLTSQTVPETYYFKIAIRKPTSEDTSLLGNMDELLNAITFNTEVRSVMNGVLDINETLDSVCGGIKTSTNLLDVSKRVTGKSISPTSGNAIIDNTTFDVSPNIPVALDDSYSTYGVYRIGLYDASGAGLGYLTLQSRYEEAHFTVDTSTFTGFSDTSRLAYMVCVLDRGYLDKAQINKGNTLLPYEPWYYSFEQVEDVDERLSALETSYSDKFMAVYETVEVPATIETNPAGRLSLVATKKFNLHNYNNPPIEYPQDIGYLYLDESTSKFYYSANRYNEPEYLFTWNTTIVNGDAPKQWIPIITPDGDIIFVTQGKEYRRVKPVIYPHGDYSNPIRPDLTQEVLPSGLTTGTGACVSTYGDFILFGEYVGNGHSELNGMPMRIWKVSKPYINPANWEVVLTKYYSNTGDPWGQDPTNEITHWHTVDFDPFTGYFYANSGDKNEFCRVFESSDNGETWVEKANGDQKWRTLGYVFTKDACYWGTDTTPPTHNLYKAERDVNGIVDFTTTEIVAACTSDSAPNYQRTYNTCLTRNPDGLLLLDRAEERSDKILHVEFFSFDDGKMHIIDTLQSTEGSATRYGFGNEATTCYQSTQEDGIITGSSSYDRKMSVDILNNKPTNRLGVCKIKIQRITPN